MVCTSLVFVLSVLPLSPMPAFVTPEGPVPEVVLAVHPGFSLVWLQASHSPAPLFRVVVPPECHGTM